MGRCRALRGPLRFEHGRAAPDPSEAPVRTPHAGEEVTHEHEGRRSVRPSAGAGWREADLRRGRRQPQRADGGLRQDGSISWIHTRHEESAAFAAGAEAHLTGELAVCAGSCGPGNLHLINGLFDAHRSRVPVLAIAAQIPSAEIGRGYFQRPTRRTCSRSAATIASWSPRRRNCRRDRDRDPRGRGRARRGGGRRARRCRPHGHARRRARPVGRPGAIPGRGAARDADLDALAGLLDGADRVTLLCGRGCAGAHAELLQLAEALKAPWATRSAARSTSSGQPLRRGHDRADRVLLGLPGECSTATPSCSSARASPTASSTRRRPRSRRSICGPGASGAIAGSISA